MMGLDARTQTHTHTHAHAHTHTHTHTHTSTWLFDRLHSMTTHVMVTFVVLIGTCWSTPQPTLYIRAPGRHYGSAVSKEKLNKMITQGLL